MKVSVNFDQRKYSKNMLLFDFEELTCKCNRVLLYYFEYVFFVIIEKN